LPSRNKKLIFLALFAFICLDLPLFALIDLDWDGWRRGRMLIL
jgi:hypothetical protein